MALQFTSVQNVSETLGVSETTVKSWIYSKQLHATKLGMRQWLIDYQDLQTFLSSHAIKRDRRRESRLREKSRRQRSK